MGEIAGVVLSVAVAVARDGTGSESLAAGAQGEVVGCMQAHAQQRPVRRGAKSGSPRCSSLAGLLAGHAEKAIAAFGPFPGGALMEPRASYLPTT